MEVLINFLLNNYIWFLIVSLILIFALIGYLVDATTEKDKKQKKKVQPITEVNEVKMEVHPSVEVYTNDEFDDPLIK